MHFSAKIANVGRRSRYRRTISSHDRRTVPHRRYGIVGRPSGAVQKQELNNRELKTVPTNFRGAADRSSIIATRCLIGKCEKSLQRWCRKWYQYTVKHT